jgi:hypothetical protein
MADINTIEQQLQTAIAQQETGGGSAGVGLSLNNPGALRYAGWESAFGATSDPSGFAKFPNAQSGFDAMLTRIKQLVSGGASLTSLINTWSPASDGNVNNSARIAQLATVTGLNATAPIQTQATGVSTPSSTVGGWLGGLLDSTSNTASSSPNVGSSNMARLAVGISGLILATIGVAALALTGGVTVVNNTLDNAGTVGKGIKGAASLAAAV